MSIKLTKKEELLILEMRKNDNSNMPIKIGYLKHDLYVFNPLYSYVLEDLETNPVSKKEMDGILKEIKDSFVLAFKKGTKFECYWENNFESWYICENNGEYDIEDQDAKWAKENLEKIQDFELNSKVNFL